MVFWSALAAILSGILPKSIPFYFWRKETRCFLHKVASAFPEIRVVDQMEPGRPVLWVRGQAPQFASPVFLLRSWCRKLKGEIFCDPHLHKIETEFGWDGIRKTTWSQKLGRAVGLLRAWQPPYDELYDGWQEVSIAWGLTPKQARLREAALAAQWQIIADRLNLILLPQGPPLEFPLLFPAGGSFQDFDDRFIATIKSILPAIRIVRYKDDPKSADFYGDKLEEFTDWIRRAPLVITNDCLYSHIAQFFAKRHVLICSRSRPRNVCFPNAGRTTIIDLGKDLSCRPCAYFSLERHDHCPAGFRRCRPLLEIEKNAGELAFALNHCLMQPA